MWAAVRLGSFLTGINLLDFLRWVIIAVPMIAFVAVPTILIMLSLVVFWIVIFHVPAVCCASETVTLSPAVTARETSREACGSVSTQAEYWTTPLVTVACVPACTRSVLVAPPIPTHVASARALVPDVDADTVGTVHVALTAVKVPPDAT